MVSKLILALTAKMSLETPVFMTVKMSLEIRLLVVVLPRKLEKSEPVGSRIAAIKNHLRFFEFRGSTTTNWHECGGHLSYHYTDITGGNNAEAFEQVARTRHRVHKVWTGKPLSRC